MIRSYLISIVVALVALILVGCTQQRNGEGARVQPSSTTVSVLQPQAQQPGPTPTALPASTQASPPVPTPTSSPVPTPTSPPAPTPTSSPIPTPTIPPTPTASPVPTPKPVNLSGSGDELTTEFDLIDGLLVVEASHSGSRNFIVQLVSAVGDRELSINTIGA